MYYNGKTDFYFRQYVLPIIALGALTILFLELITEIASSLLSDAKKDALEQMAYIDGLTGIANRRGFNQYIDKYVTNSRRNKQQDNYVIYSFDLNKLKYVNDNYGHSEGDTYIKVFAEIIRKVFEKGYCARIGGDEFIAIHDTSISSVDIIKNVDDKVSVKNTDINNEYKLAYSVGYAEYHPYVDDIEEIIKKADSNMYDMKVQL